MRMRVASQTKTVLLIYLGRQGLFPFTSVITRAFLQRSDHKALLTISRENVDFAQFADLGERLMPVDTFRRGLGALQLWRARSIGRELAQRVKQEGITHVVTLMPHVWSWAIAPALRAAGARYCTILHDAQRHPGDHRGLAHPLLMRDIAVADQVFTLSDSVARHAIEAGRLDPSRNVTLFHPVLGEPRPYLPPPDLGEPWRVLFMGRIMAYKGLPLLVAALKRLNAQGRRISLTVMGEGDLGAEQAELTAMGANVVNRWVSDEEMAQALSSHHLLMLSHVEASQSGIAAMALGAAMPVVATPVGGLREQIEDGETGVLARAVDAAAFGDALCRVMDDPELYRHIGRIIAARREAHSPERFVDLMIKALD